MLTLPTKKKWFDMLLSGEKQDEYREIKPYYSVRFAKQLGFIGAIEIMDKSLRSNQSISFQVMFRNGYSSESIINYIFKRLHGKVIILKVSYTKYTLTINIDFYDKEW